MIFEVRDLLKSQLLKVFASNWWCPILDVLNQYLNLKSSQCLYFINEKQLINIVSEGNNFNTYVYNRFRIFSYLLLPSFTLILLIHCTMDSFLPTSFRVFFCLPVVLLGDGQFHQFNNKTLVDYNLPKIG